jgi:hypothetical protein
LREDSRNPLFTHPTNYLLSRRAAVEKMQGCQALNRLVAGSSTARHLLGSGRNAFGASLASITNANQSLDYRAQFSAVALQPNSKKEEEAKLMMAILLDTLKNKNTPLVQSPIMPVFPRTTVIERHSPAPDGLNRISITVPHQFPGADKPFNNLPTNNPDGNVWSPLYQVMNRNARKAKRANHGKRPCSRDARRRKRRANGNHRR